jgi:hypothetical protein
MTKTIPNSNEAPRAATIDSGLEDIEIDTVPEPANPDRPLTSSFYVTVAMALTAIVLPTLSLVVLGSIWLWQNGGVLIWAAAATVVSLVTFGLEWLLVRRTEKQSAAPPISGVAVDGPTAEDMPAAREAAARSAIAEMTRGVKAEDISSRDAAIALARRSVETVARQMHPGEKNAALNFTVPEALTLVERVSGRLNGIVQDIPFASRLTVGQAMAVYRWRGLFGVAEKAYGLWRILRLANPAAAAAGELRERVSGQLLQGARSELLRRLARAYVKEIADAAIDLYSGRLRPAQANKDAARGERAGEDEQGRFSL